MPSLNQNAITLLSAGTLVDMNSGSAQPILTAIPGISGCYITHIIISQPSISLNTASYSFGWNGASYNDVVADATHTELTSSNMYTVLSPMLGATIGTAGQLFNMLVNTLQGSAATAIVFVFGYYVP
jgi:hypothetical protein